MQRGNRQVLLVLLVMLMITIFGGVRCAYFNAFYNARKNFREAEKENRQIIQEQTGRPQTQKYNSAIESAARLLQNYPDSKWADDALLLMGKAYYRIQQYNRAQRKFEELFANHPDSPLIPEGKYWWSLTIKEMGKFQDGIDQLRSLLGSDIPRDLDSKVRFSLADMLFEEESFEKARVEYGKIVEKSKDHLDRANAQYRVAECFALAEKDTSAASAFINVLKYKPKRKLEFDAQFQYGIVLKELQRFDEVKEIFETLLDKDIYFSYFPKVELELADLLYKTGEKEEARSKYGRLAELHPRTEISARAYYELGLIALKDDRDMDMAREHFSKVRGEFAQSKYVPDAQAEIASLDSYRDVSEAREQVAAQIISLEEALRSLREAASESDSLKEISGDSESDSIRLKEQINGLYLDLDARDYRIAEYYLYDLGDLDSTITYLTFLVRPGVADSIRAKSLVTMATLYRDSLNNHTVGDSFYQVLITDYQGTDFENFARQKLGLPQKLTPQDSLAFEFSRADSLLWDQGDTLGAIQAFQQLALGDTTSVLAAKSQYNVGWIYENLL
ncbi:hypothetical protein AMJ86_04265, partial [bacterium SM23_57]